jgi:outer membrane receptor protein involved in Fe transport
MRNRGIGAFPTSLVWIFLICPVLSVQALATTNFDASEQSLDEPLKAPSSQAATNLASDPQLVVAPRAPAMKDSHTVERTLAEEKKTSSDEFRLAQIEQASTSAATAPPGASAGRTDASQTQLEEILVTAQKKTEALQDVPIPVTVISADSLTENNQVKLADYFSQVPGLAMAQGTMSSQTLSIRGITTGAVGTGPPAPSPTVGITVDDVPFGGSGGGDTMVPDFDPGDLERVEVLRGPQGTLYGASSLGGLIKYVTVDPSTDKVSGRLEAGTDSVHNGAELGYTFRGSLNLPIDSDLAVRASAFARQDPGYIDNPILHIDGVNEDHAYGGHLAALWLPTDTLSLKVSALYQDTKGDGTSDSTPNPPGVPPLGDLQQYYIRGVGAYDREVQAYSAVLKDKVGNIDLTALTGYNTYSIRDSLDYSEVFGALGQTNFGVAGAGFFDNINFNRFTQELRLSAALGEKIDWLLGGFYSHEVDKYQWPVLAINPTSGAVAGNFGTYNSTDAPITYTEASAFADLTLHVNDRIDVQLGGRESQYRIVGKTEMITGLFRTAVIGLPSDNAVLFPEYTLKQNAFTYLLTPRFKISSDLMAYVRLASGYRPGGSNAGTPTVPQAFNPDKTKDYELGVKGEFLDHRLSIDASLYYIDWKNIQLPLLYICCSYTGNAGSAKSQGVELSAALKPVSSLSITAWVAWNDAELTQAVPSIFGHAGDRLPNTPRFSGNLSLLKEFPVTSEITGFVGGTVGYVSDREDTFSTGTPQRQYLPSYAKTDLRAGTEFDAWKVTFYVNNVADKRGLISGGVGNLIPYSFYFIQPRTVGLSVSRTF